MQLEDEFPRYFLTYGIPQNARFLEQLAAGSIRKALNTRLFRSITSSRDEGRRRIGSINSAFIERTPTSMPLCWKNRP